MKKFIIILVLIVYSATSMGATVHLHYCMNNFSGWDLWLDDKEGKDEKCGKCGMKEKKGGCCKDEHKKIKIEDNHQKSIVAEYVEVLSAPALVTPFSNYIFKATSEAFFIPFSNAPPPIPKRLHLLHCVFLI